MQPRQDRGEEADVGKTAEGNTGSAVGAWHYGSSGGGEQGMRTRRFTQEPGRPVPFRSTIPAGGTG